jgi:hypothetical protein
MMDLEKMAESIRQQFPIYENAGLKILQADEVFKARVILGEKTQNHVHMMHAAFLFLGGEFLGGLVPMRHLKHPEKFQPVVRDLKIDFKAPALTSVTAQAHFSQAQADEMNQKLEETGRFDFTLLAELTDEAGTLVAQTMANYALRNFSGK